MGGASPPPNFEALTLMELVRLRGYTLKTLANQIGTSPRTLEAYTSGRRDLADARAKLVIDLAAALDVDPADLLRLVRPT